MSSPRFSVRSLSAIVAIVSLCLVATSRLPAKGSGDLFLLGDNEYGQLLLGGERLVREFTEIDSDVTDVTTTLGYTLYRKTDGTAWATGSAFEAFGNGAVQGVEAPVQVATGIKAFGKGTGSFSLLIDDDDDLLGSGNTILWDFLYTDTLTQLDANVKLAIATESNFGVVLHNDGKLRSQGSTGAFGWIGKPSTVGESFDLAEGVVDVCLTVYGVVYVTEDGNMYGSGDGGDIGFYAYTYDENALHPVLLDTDVSSVEGGDGFIIYRKNSGEVWGLGANEFGQLGLGKAVSVTQTPLLIADNAEAVFAGPENAYYIDEEGQLWGMGRNAFGNLGLGHEEIVYEPTIIFEGASTVGASWYATLIVDDEGKLFAAGSKMDGVLGLPVPESAKVESSNQIGEPIESVRFAEADSAAFGYVDEGGSLWCWGRSNGGMLGNLGKTLYYEPVVVADGVKSFGISDDLIFILKTDGSVWYRGSVAGGRFGYEEDTYIERWKFLADGVSDIWSNYSTLLLLKHGQILCFGDTDIVRRNDSEEMPDHFAELTPVASNVRALVGGGFWISEDGELMSYGGLLSDNNELYETGEEIGDGVVNIDSEVIFAAETDATVFYIKSDHSLWAAGLDLYGGPLDRGNAFSLVPVKVDDGVEYVDINSDAAYYLKTDGSAWLLGADAFGLAGEGESSTQMEPVQVLDGRRFVGVTLSLWNLMLIAEYQFDLVDESAATLAYEDTASLLVSDGGEGGDYVWTEKKDGGDSTVVAESVSTIRVQPVEDTVYTVTYTNESDEEVTREIRIEIRNLEFIKWAKDYGYDVSDQELGRDDDFDSHPIYLEYALGMDPSQSESGVVELVDLENEDGERVFRHRFDAVTEAELLYQVSDDAENWRSLSVGEDLGLEEEEGYRVVTIYRENQARFFRIAVRPK